MRIRVNLTYLILFVALLLIEVTIAILNFNSFMRGFLGDVLVIPLIYSFFKIFLKISCGKLAFGILLFACAIELLQLFNLIEVFSIKSEILRVILGSVFDPFDFLAYVLGFVIVLVIEGIFGKNKYSFF